jgi:hypothetical protein
MMGQGQGEALEVSAHIDRPQDRGRAELGAPIRGADYLQPGGRLGRISAAVTGHSAGTPTLRHPARTEIHSTRGARCHGLVHLVRVEPVAVAQLSRS